MITIVLWLFVCSFCVWFGIKTAMGIRVIEEEEYKGCDVGECGMKVYPEFTSGSR